MKPTSQSPAAPSVAPALAALLESFIDYAGLFPPAAVSLDEAVKNYEQYKESAHSFMLRWLVVPQASAAQVPPSLADELSVLSDGDCAAAAIESKIPFVSGVSARPVYCEIAPGDTAGLDKAVTTGCFAKIRTGGVVAEAFPTPAQVAAFINDCSTRGLAFKATAGLHHPVRSLRPLTYEKDAPRAVMHGFVNLLMAAAFSYNGDRDIEAILAEEDPGAFKFDDCARWRHKSLTIAQIKEARRHFVHAVGSCSFVEPVADLQELGWL